MHNGAMYQAGIQAILCIHSFPRKREAMRILIVDDERSIRDLLVEKLSSLGYEVLPAPDGLEGLRLVEQVRPDIMILDVNMPVLDGYGVLSRLRAMENVPHTYVIMLTARAELAEVERGLEAGADDYLPKPFELRELVARVHAAERVQKLQEELLLKNRQLNEAIQALQASLRQQALLNRKMMQELEMAARLQTSMLSPARMDQGPFQILTRYRPVANIGGDFYDLRPLGGNLASIFLADAVGHGVSAALLAAMLKIALEDALSAETRPSKILSLLNHAFQFCADRGKYLTAFSGVLNCETGLLVYALAGHVPPLLYKRSNRDVKKLESTGFCLGVFGEGGYVDQEIQISSGDRLFAFTDGISEASPDDLSVFGAMLPALLRENAQLENEEFLNSLDAILGKFLGNASPTDDYTLLTVHRLN